MARGERHRTRLDRPKQIAGNHMRAIDALRPLEMRDEQRAPAEQHGGTRLARHLDAVRHAGLHEQREHDGRDHHQPFLSVGPSASISRIPPSDPSTPVASYGM